MLVRVKFKSSWHDMAIGQTSRSQKETARARLLLWWPTMDKKHEVKTVNKLQPAKILPRSAKMLPVGRGLTSNFFEFGIWIVFSFGRSYDLW